MPLTTLHNQLINKLSDGKFHSGTELGVALEVSRAAIWKAIKNLETLGLEVHSVKGKGYRLEQALCLLESSKIMEAISKKSAAKIQHLEILESIDSTNSFAMRQLQEKLVAPLPGQYAVYLSEQQTQGKGRRGRQWVSPYGQNVYLTMVRNIDTGVISTEGLSLVIGLAIVRTLKDLGLNGLGVKWPNDVLCKNRKLAGILLEITGDVTGICQLLIGVGINIKCKPHDMQEVTQPWTDIYEHKGDHVERNSLIALTLSHIIKAMDEYETNNMKFFLKEWQKYDVMSGKEAELKTSNSSQFGVVRGISKTGALLFETEEGVQLINGGEISLRSAKN